MWHVEALTDSCRLNPNKFTDTPLVKNNSATNVSFVTLQLYHGLPWFTTVNHGISPCLHYGIAEELIQLEYTITNTYIRPHLEYCVQVWSPYLRKDIECIEKIQRRATELVHGFNKRSVSRSASRTLFMGYSRSDSRPTVGLHLRVTRSPTVIQFKNKTDATAVAYQQPTWPSG